MVRNMIRNFLIIIVMAGLFSCKAQQSLDTVPNVNIDRYAGTWYEVARFPNTFEKGLECVSATYTPLANGKIEVLNKGVKAEGKVKSITGKAWRPDANREGVLKVSFFWPFAGDYYIIALDEDYKTALVGSPTRKYLWILSRTKELSAAQIDEYKKIAKDNGFDPNKLEMVRQDC
jgi:apolipoprotein D and lipocalin family protein